MNTRPESNRIRHRIGKACVAASAAILAVVLMAPPALADGGHRDRDRHHGSRHDRGHGADRDHRHQRYEGRRGHHSQFRGRRHHDRDYSHGHRGYRHGHRNFSIPRTIVRDRFDPHRPYFHGRSYFRPHRHHHSVYRFPVYTDYGVSYRYYPYCEGNLYADGISGRVRLHGDRFSIDVGF